MDNLELYNRVRSVPEEAKKKITAGRTKGYPGSPASAGGIVSSWGKDQPLVCHSIFRFRQLIKKKHAAFGRVKGRLLHGP